MSYCVSNMIGIRTGGVFSDDTDMEDMKKRIALIIRQMREGGNKPDLGDASGDPSHCMSEELFAHKGSYVVLAGVFNYWRFDEVAQFATRLSKEFVTEVMLMSWDEEQDTVQCQVYLDGKPLFKVRENPVGRVLRRVT